MTRPGGRKGSAGRGPSRAKRVRSTGGGGGGGKKGCALLLIALLSLPVLGGYLIHHLT